VVASSSKVAGRHVANTDCEQPRTPKTIVRLSPVLIDQYSWNPSPWERTTLRTTDSRPGANDRRFSGSFSTDKRADQDDRKDRVRHPEPHIARVAGRNAYRLNKRTRTGAAIGKMCASSPSCQYSYKSVFHAIRQSLITLHSIIVVPIKHPVTRSRLRQS
jgi:hypothetical protein